MNHSRFVRKILACNAIIYSSLSRPSTLTFVKNIVYLYLTNFLDVIFLHVAFPLYHIVTTVVLSLSLPRMHANNHTTFVFYIPISSPLFTNRILCSRFNSIRNSISLSLQNRLFHFSLHPIHLYTSFSYSLTKTKQSISF